MQLSCCITAEHVGRSVCAVVIVQVDAQAHGADTLFLCMRAAFLYRVATGKDPVLAGEVRCCFDAARAEALSMFRIKLTYFIVQPSSALTAFWLLPGCGGADCDCQAGQGVLGAHLGVSW